MKSKTESEVITVEQIKSAGKDNINATHETVPRMVTINELAKLVDISTYAIRRLVKTNQITYFRSGAKVLINFDRFIDFLNGK